MNILDKPANSRKLITVLGGSGFVGKHVVASLAKKGYNVRIASRNPERNANLRLLGRPGQIQIVKANIRYPQTIMATLKDADAVINLIGIEYERGRQTFKAIHIDGAHHVAEMAAHKRIPLIHFSALGVNEIAKGALARSKATGEKLVKQIYPDSIILKPSIIFGPGDKSFTKLASFLSLIPVIGLFDHGRAKVQPVYVGDVANMVTYLIAEGATAKKIFELVGPQTLSLKEIIQLIAKYTQRNVYFFPFSFSVSYWIARASQTIAQVTNSQPLLNADFLLSCQKDNLLSQTAKNAGRTLEEARIVPLSLESYIKDSFKYFRPQGLYTDYKSRQKSPK